MLLNAEDPEGYSQWLRHWKELPGHEPCAHPAYAMVFAGGKCRPLCFCFKSAKGTILFPVLLRELKAEAWASPQLAATDLVTPYGYGGPFIWQSPEQSVFWEEFSAEVTRLKAVCLFARLFLFVKNIAPIPGDTSFKCWNVVRECDSSPEQIWMDYEHKVRKNVKTAVRNGVSVEIDPSGEHLDDFIRVSLSTMDRRAAKPEYRFDRQFYQDLIKKMPDQLCFFHAKVRGEIISTELVLVSDDNVYSFLGGTEERCFDLRPNDILKHEIILWSREKGKRAYVLGGGYSGEDGIFRYKRSFAPRGLVPFRVGRMVFEPDLYSELVQMRKVAENASNSNWEPNANFFPAYRS